MAERLPEFYRTWDKDSVIFKLIDAFARSLNEQQQDIFRIARTHWVETACHSDLDGLGEVFDLARMTEESDDDYRRRLKNGVQQFRGGGTRESVLTIVASFLKVPVHELTLEENPPVQLSVSRTVRGDAEWTLGSMSIADASPRIEVTAVNEGERLVDPSLTVKETGASVRYRGTVMHGQTLVVERDFAELDGVDVSAHVERYGQVSLLRGGSRWSFHEAISSLVGAFDKAIFDGSVYQKPMPTAKIRFQWTSRPPSTFELTIPGQAIRRSRASLEELEGLLNVIRAQGVKSTLRVRE